MDINNSDADTAFVPVAVHEPAVSFIWNQKDADAFVQQVRDGSLSVNAVESGFAMVSLIGRLAQLANWQHVTELLQRGANPHAGVEHYRTAFRWIVAHGQMALVEGIVEGRYSGCASLVAESGSNILSFALRTATSAGQTETARYLLKKGATFHADVGKDVVAALECGFTDVVLLLLEHSLSTETTAFNRKNRILHYACEYKNMDVVKALVERGAALDVQNEDEQTPLSIAISRDNNIAKLLLSAGASTHNVDSKSSALMWACVCGNSEMFDLLMETDGGDDVMLPDSMGLTPLHAAAGSGNLHIATELLAYGADVHATSRHGLTPFHDAAQHNNRAMMQLLLDHGADISARSADGRTAMDLACMANAVDCMDFLLQHGMDIHARASDGSTALHKAQSMVCVKFLLSHGADIHSARLDGYTPLHVAVTFSRVQVVEQLLIHGANVNARANNGTMPLHAALRQKHTPMVALLLAHGAHQNTPLPDGSTPLHLAAENALYECFKHLVRNGGDVALLNGAGRSALDLACKLGTVTMMSTATIVAAIAAGADFTRL